MTREEYVAHAEEHGYPVRVCVGNNIPCEANTHPSLSRHLRPGDVLETWEGRVVHAIYNVDPKFRKHFRKREGGLIANACGVKYEWIHFAAPAAKPKEVQ